MSSVQLLSVSFCSLLVSVLVVVLGLKTGPNWPWSVLLDPMLTTMNQSTANTTAPMTTTTTNQSQSTANTTLAPSQCATWASQYGIVPGQTWGSIPEGLQGMWNMSNCNSAINTPTGPAAQCTAWAKQYGIVPYQTWGSMPASLHGTWDSSNCNAYVTAVTVQTLPPVNPAATSANTVVVKTAQRTGGVVPKELFGACMSNVSFSEPNVGSNGGYISAMKSLNWPFLRYNGAESFMGQVFPGRGQAANWGWVDQFKVLPQIFSGKFMMDTGIFAPWMDSTNPSDIHLYCQQMQQVAQRMKSNGINVDYWEIMNEPELHGISMDSAAAALVGSAPLLIQVFPNCRVGGPALSWANPANLTPFVGKVGATSQFYSYHWYATGDANFPAGSAYQAALGMNGNASGAAGTIRGSNGGASFELALTEYNMDYNWSPGDQLQLQAENAVFSALGLFQALTGGVTMASIWDSYGDSDFGVISQDFSTIYPVGYALSRLAATVPGAMVSTNIGSGLNNLYVVATVPQNGGSVATVLVNYDTGNDLILYLSFDVGVSQLTRWEVSNSNPRGVISSQSPSAAVSVPRNSVVILTG